MLAITIYIQLSEKCNFYYAIHIYRTKTPNKSLISLKEQKLNQNFEANKSKL